MPSEKTREKALSALEGMAEIVRHEMLTRGAYATDEVVSEALAAKGAICGGRKYCAVGALWAGYGVKYDLLGANLPGVSEDLNWDWRSGDDLSSDRASFLNRHPGLKLAYAALNDAADSYRERHAVRVRQTYTAPIEALFESTSSQTIGRPQMLRIISSAKRKVKNAI